MKVIIPLSIWFGITIGSFLAQLFTSHNWEKAIIQSEVALILVLITVIIRVLGIRRVRR